MRPSEGHGADPLAGWDDPLELVIVQPALEMGSPERNLARAVSLIEGALSEGRSDLVSLPEAFATGFPFSDLSSVRPFQERITDVMKGLAAKHRTDIIYTQLVEEGGAVRNRCFHLGASGEVLGSYDKTHLFSRSGEDRHVRAGDELSIFRVGPVRVGPLICYEIRFPELSRRLMAAGAAVLVYPAEWPAHRIFQWEHLLHARAVENQCFVVGSNVCGHHSRVRMGGRSMAVSPYGDTLCELGSEEGWARCVLDPGRMKDVREKVPAYRGLRTGLSGPDLKRP